VGSGADLRRGRIPGERNGAGEERGKEAARHTLFILAEIQVSVVKDVSGRQVKEEFRRNAIARTTMLVIWL
jgi:hypothetical protein